MTNEKARESHVDWPGVDALVAEGTARRLTTCQVVELRSVVLEWPCEARGCKHVLRFPADQVDAIPFFIVRHMLKDHGMRTEEVVDMEPSMSGDVDAYCRQMEVRG